MKALSKVVRSNDADKIVRLKLLLLILLLLHCARWLGKWMRLLFRLDAMRGRC